jgi:hypothetical protein
MPPARDLQETLARGVLQRSFPPEASDVVQSATSSTVEPLPSGVSARPELPESAGAGPEKMTFRRELTMTRKATGSHARLIQIGQCAKALARARRRTWQRLRWVRTAAEERAVLVMGWQPCDRALVDHLMRHR